MTSSTQQQEDPAPRQAPAFAQALLGSVTDGLYTVDAAGRVTSLNPAAEALLGWSQATLRGRDAHATLHFQRPNGAPYDRDDCPLLSVLRTGQAAQVAADAFTRADGRVLEVSYSSSPIVEDGHVTGAVVIFRDESTVRESERRARELAEERERSSAEWQRNLLPARLPVIDGVDLAVTFRPAGGEHVLVGGDFFDVIHAPDGHVVALGDVRGKGAGAAAIAAMLRYVLRGAAQASSDLPALIALLNRELLAHPATRFATMALVHFGPERDGRIPVEVLTAGHPSPVFVRADGHAEEVAATGRLLGVFDGVQAKLARLELQAGDTLVLYSDGLVDVGRRLGREGFDVLDALDGHAPNSSSDLITRLEQVAQVPDISERPDDICVLVARATPGGSAAPTAPAPERPASSDPVEIALIEDRFREDNDRLVAGRPATEGTVTITCECANRDCVELLDIDRDVYRQVRADPRGFLVLPGHELLAFEDVVERHPAWLRVRKRDIAGRLAELVD